MGVSGLGEGVAVLKVISTQYTSATYEKDDVVISDFSFMLTTFGGGGPVFPHLRKRKS
jgi:hypothetical protein